MFLAIVQIKCPPETLNVHPVGQTFITALEYLFVTIVWVGIVHLCSETRCKDPLLDNTIGHG